MIRPVARTLFETDERCHVGDDHVHVKAVSALPI